MTFIPAFSLHLIPAASHPPGQVLHEVQDENSLQGSMKYREKGFGGKALSAEETGKWRCGEPREGGEREILGNCKERKFISFLSEKEQGAQAEAGQGPWGFLLQLHPPKPPNPPGGAKPWEG